MIHGLISFFFLLFYDLENLFFREESESVMKSEKDFSAVSPTFPPLPLWRLLASLVKVCCWILSLSLVKAWSVCSLNGCNFIISVWKRPPSRSRARPAERRAEASFLPWRSTADRGVGGGGGGGFIFTLQKKREATKRRL